jgi:uncharacterized membrane protein
MDEQLGAFWIGVHWVHLVSMAFFVGGQIFLAAVVVPALRAEATRPALRTIARRFGYGTLIAIGFLLASGIAMASHEHRWDDGTLQAKLTLVVVVAGLVLWHMRRPTAHALEGLIFLGSLAIVWMGLAIAH